MTHPPKIDDAPPVVRRSVKRRSNYGDYREELRRDFWFCCASCSTGEAKATGISFEIDHYLPKAHFDTKISDYENLYYSCDRCNGLKDDYFLPPCTAPTNYIIRPDTENPEKHIQGVGERCEPLTDTGKFNIDVLALNRQALRRIRSLRKEIESNQRYITRGASILSGLPIDALPKSLRMQAAKVDSKLRAKALDLSKKIDDFITALNKSTLVDPDPEKELHTRARREALARAGAIVPKLPTTT